MLPRLIYHHILWLEVRVNDILGVQMPQSLEQLHGDPLRLDFAESFLLLE